MSEDFLTILTTTDRKVSADALARALVERKLAACVQVMGPVESTYRWKGKVETTAEWVCVIKSRSTLYETVEQAIREVHPYEVPEIFAIPIVRGSQAYLSWLGETIES